MGDAVFSLLVRRELIKERDRPVKNLHDETLKYVSASSQYKISKKICSLLNEEEYEMYKRGRNAKSGHLPKNASVDEYHAATGIETLFGYLYLQGNQARIEEIFTSIIKDMAHETQV